MKERFGELRSLLQKSPGEQTWFEVQKLFESWEDGVSSAPGEQGRIDPSLILYARDHLSRWSPEICSLRIEEISSWRRAVKRAWFSCVSHLILEGECIHAIELAAGRAHNVCILGVSDIDRRGVLELARSELCDGAYVLDLSGNVLSDDDFITWLEEQHASNLRVLDLSENELTEHVVSALGESGLLEQLDVLLLAENQLGYRGVELMEELLKEHPIECDLSENGVDTTRAGRNEVGWRGWEQFTDLDEWEKWSEWDREAVSWQKELDEDPFVDPDD